MIAWHDRNEAGTPTGGSSYGDGFAIAWTGQDSNAPAHATGATILDVLDAVQDRLAFWLRTQNLPDDRRAMLTKTVDHVAAAVQLQQDALGVY